MTIVYNSIMIYILSIFSHRSHCSIFYSLPRLLQYKFIIYMNVNVFLLMNLLYE